MGDKEHEQLRVSNHHLLMNDYAYYDYADSRDERLRLRDEIAEEEKREKRDN